MNFLRRLTGRPRTLISVALPLSVSLVASSLITVTGASAHLGDWHRARAGYFENQTWWSPYYADHQQKLAYVDNAPERNYREWAVYAGSINYQPENITTMMRDANTYTGLATDTKPGGGCFDAFVMDSSWTNLPDPVYFREDDGRDGRYEEQNMMVRGEAALQGFYNYYFYSLYWDSQEWHTGNPCSLQSEMNFSSYLYYTNGNRADSRWHSKLTLSGGSHDLR